MDLLGEGMRIRRVSLLETPARLFACVLAPTRDLIRQHVTYFTERLAGTGLGVGHGAPGTLKWKFGTDNEVESSPSIAVDGTIYVTSGDSSLYGLVDPKVLGEAFLFDPVPGSQRRELREEDGQSISVQLTTINATPVHEGRLVLSAQTFIDARAGTDPGAIRLRGYRPFLEAAPVMIRVNHLPPGAPPGRRATTT